VERSLYSVLLLSALIAGCVRPSPAVPQSEPAPVAEAPQSKPEAAPAPATKTPDTETAVANQPAAQTPPSSPPASGTQAANAPPTEGPAAVPPAKPTAETPKEAAPPAPASKPPAANTAAKPPATTASKSPASTAPAAGKPPSGTPIAKTPVPSAPAASSPAPKPPAPVPAPASSAALPLDLEALKQELRETKAIGIFTKLTLKNQVDDLLDQFRALHKGRPKPTLSDLRRSYDLLMMKVLSLLQDKDQKLASQIVSSRETIWGLLADAKKFAALDV